MRRRLLLVDDEPAIRLLCRVNLPLAGFDVVEGSAGGDALARARREPLRLAPLDAMMPGMSGFERADQLHADERTAPLPIVFLSARADRSDVRRGFELGAVDYVTKPFDPLQLGSRLHTVLARLEDQ